MWAAIFALFPLILELLKVFSNKDTSEAKKIEAVEEAKASLRDAIARTRAAIDKAEETEGDTSDLESVVNGPRR